jgi:DNA-binding NtrC family response regulator
MSVAHPDVERQSWEVLVVEDDPTTRSLVRNGLLKDHFHVCEAECATDAIEMLQEGRLFDAVFTDVIMPGQVDGVGFARWVRARYPELPVILGSATPLPLDVCKEFEFLLKPYDMDALSVHLRALLKRLSFQKKPTGTGSLETPIVRPPP